jgi:hypothetical protein
VEFVQQIVRDEMRSFFQIQGATRELVGTNDRGTTQKLEKRPRRSSILTAKRLVVQTIPFFIMYKLLDGLH